MLVRDKVTSGDYSKMASYYDVIMTSGYYDYNAIVDDIVQFTHVQSVLELGAGTGLILERLVTRQPKFREVMGIDLTRAMLDIAQDRLEKFPNVQLSLQNVCSLDLNSTYDLAFSYGGVWYFVMDGVEPHLVSHIPDHADNEAGFNCLSQTIAPGGTLLLGVQAPHRDYETSISNGMKYSQRIQQLPHGFRKDYYLKDDGHTVMAQTLDYRTYPLEKALKLLAEYGFEFVGRTKTPAKLFMEFKKV
jgi:SAM-dependent methyltransferase